MTVLYSSSCNLCQLLSFLSCCSGMSSLIGSDSSPRFLGLCFLKELIPNNEFMD